MEDRVVFNEGNKSKKFRANPESPFFQITKVIVPSIAPNDKEMATKMPSSSLKCVVIDSGGIRYESYIFNDLRALINPIQRIPVFEINNTISINSNIESIELFYEHHSGTRMDVEVYFTRFNKTVDFAKPFSDFHEHLELPDNVKIMVSAPFGQGKSTFINHYFDEHNAKYEVFKIFPVNYSISHNEDVFKYIKAEILYQLLSRNVEFDKESFSYFQTAPEFFKNDPIRILSPFIKLIPKVGKSAYEIFNQINKLAKEYFDFHDKMKVDDMGEAEMFIKQLYEKEGSIFEDNFYTQLIRQQLEKLKTKSNKKNVLIIEDLDRMDPDHIFRILNVFAAHFDTQEFTSGYSNKFGFDKIIIVGDYNNIKHIFEYRYGPKVDFGGYLNKYYSREPFIYDNKKAISELVHQIRKRYQKTYSILGFDLITCVLGDLASSENITLRELLKLLKEESPHQIIFGERQKNESREKSYFHLFAHFNLFYFLTKAIDIDALILKFEKCKNHVNSITTFSYDDFTLVGLPSLVVHSHIDKGDFGYYFKDIKLSFSVKFDYNHDSGYEFYNVQNIKKTSNLTDATSSHFSRSDFYDMLILNAKKYKEVGGFE